MVAASQLGRAAIRAHQIVGLQNVHDLSGILHRSLSVTVTSTTTGHTERDTHTHNQGAGSRTQLGRSAVRHRGASVSTSGEVCRPPTGRMPCPRTLTRIVSSRVVMFRRVPARDTRGRPTTPSSLASRCARSAQPGPAGSYYRNTMRLPVTNHASSEHNQTMVAATSRVWPRGDVPTTWPRPRGPGR